MSIGKILIVYFPMAMNAERYAIRYFKTQIWFTCEWLNMMSVEISSRSTLLALEIIAFIYGTSPILKLPRESYSCRLEARPIFPSPCEWSNPAHASTMPRTKNRFSVFARKVFAAVWALLSLYRVSLCPTGLATKFGTFGTISMSPIGLAADRAGEINSFTSRQDFAALNCHDGNITSAAQNSKFYSVYCDVIVQRFEDFTGKKAKREGRHAKR
jgi:hypothetical protein